MFYFETFSDFLAMGRHGFFVGSAYGIALGIIVVMVIAPIQRGKAIRKVIQRQIRRDAVAETQNNTAQQTIENKGMENN